jgi:hypothetical protein
MQPWQRHHPDDKGDRNRRRDGGSQGIHKGQVLGLCIPGRCLPPPYGKLIEDLENDYTMANDKYPKSMTEAYNLLVYWKQDPRNLMRVLGTSSDGVAFTNVGRDRGHIKKCEETRGQGPAHHIPQMRKSGPLCK